VDYTIPFALITSVEPRAESGDRRVKVTLRSDEVLRLDPRGDLGQENAGVLVFSNRQARPEYVPWSDVEKIDFGEPGEGASPG
jgi:hypothetical protein